MIKNKRSWSGTINNAAVGVESVIIYIQLLGLFLWRRQRKQKVR